jgi:hypothetical protein
VRVSGTHRGRTVHESAQPVTDQRPLVPQGMTTGDPSLPL